MKWKKVGRLTLPMKGQLVKWAESQHVELVRAEGTYQFQATSGDQAYWILRRCPHCGNVEILDSAWESYHCSECREISEVVEL